MSLIEIHHLSFTYENSCEPVFQGVDLRLDTDWRLGLIGRNGRGKTTLLRLLTGELKGRGSIDISVKPVYFPYDLPHGIWTTEEVAQRLSPPGEAWRVWREWNLLGLKEELREREFASLSNGERTRVLLAALFAREDAYPLIDEPTNHLDLEGRECVAEYLKGKRGFLLVSHDRAFLDRCVDHVAVLNRNSIELQRGNFSSWWNNKELRDQFELAERERLKKDIKKLEEAARRAADWSNAVEKTKYGTQNSGLRPDRGYIGHKSAKMMKRAKSAQLRREKAVEKKSGLLRDTESTESLKLRPLDHGRKQLVELIGFAPDHGMGPVCAPLDLSVGQGERIALTGPNGCGKSSVLKAVLGEKMGHIGLVRRTGGIVISYVAQDTSFLRGSMEDFISESGLQETLFKTILRKLDFQRSQFERSLEQLSAGQKKKVLIARSLCQTAHLYLWDEPLNFVDVWSRMQLEELLLTYRPTMLFVEHDRTFTEKIATRQIGL